MAWFSSGFGEGFQASITPFSDYPITVVAWVKLTSTGNRCIYSQFTAGASHDAFTLNTVTSTNVLRVRCGAFDGGPADTVNALTIGEWSLCVGIAASATSRKVVLNADFANEGTDTASFSWPSTDTTSIGNGPTIIDNFNGTWGIVFVYAAALTDSEITALNLGLHPSRIRPDKIVQRYLLNDPGQSDARDYSGNGHHLDTVNGTPDFSLKGPPIQLRIIGQGSQFNEAVAGVSGTSAMTMLLPVMAATGEVVIQPSGTSAMTMLLPTMVASGVVGLGVSGTSAMTMLLPIMRATGVVFENAILSQADLQLQGRNLRNINTIYFGNTTINGSWRAKIDGANFIFQKLEAGVWVTKSTITP